LQVRLLIVVRYFIEENGMQLKRTIIYFLLILLLAISSKVLFAAQSDKGNNNSIFTNSESLFDLLEASSEDVFEDQSADLEKVWDQLEKDEEQKWQRLEAEVLQTWDVYHPTTKKVWVDYSPQKESLSKVDFEKGEVTIEALVPLGSDPEEAKLIVKKQLENITKKTDSTNTSVLKELLPENTEISIETKKIEIAPAEVITGKDGVVRQKFKMKISMVPNHLQKRIKRYFPRVSSTAKGQGVDPALVLAVIHSESAFNPFARSAIPAFGLMQIVPRYAGKDAYMDLFGKEKVLSSEYLYNADNNILIGVAYLRLLHNRYFYDIHDLDKRRFIVVCAYNWGPTAMRNRLLSKVNVQDTSRGDLFALLLKRVPKETHDYLKRVEKRREMYSRSME